MSSHVMSTDGTVVTHDAAVRLVHDFLLESGYSGAASVLQTEACLPCRRLSASERAELSRAVLHGEYDTVLEYITGEILLSATATTLVWEAIVCDLAVASLPAVVAPGAGGRTCGGVAGGFVSATVASPAAKAEEMLRRHPALLRLRTSNAARYVRLLEACHHPAAKLPLPGEPGTTPEWRTAAWAAVEAELLPSLPSTGAVEGESQALEAKRSQWASMLLAAAAPGCRRQRPVDLDCEAAADASDRRLALLASNQQRVERVRQQQASDNDRTVEPFRGQHHGVVLPTAAIGSSASDSIVALARCSVTGGVACATANGIIAFVIPHGSACAGVLTPTNKVDLVSLDGRLASTAGAVACIAFGESASSESGSPDVVLLLGFRNGSVAALRCSSSAASPGQGWTTLWVVADACSTGFSSVCVVQPVRGSKVVAGDFTGGATVLDGTSGHRVKLLRGHRGPVYDVCAVGETAITACGDGVLRSFRLSSTSSEDPVWASSFPPTEPQDGCTAGSVGPTPPVYRCLAIGDTEAPEEEEQRRTPVVLAVVAPNRLAIVNTIDGNVVAMSTVKRPSKGRSSNTPVFDAETVVLPLSPDASSVLCVSRMGCVDLLRKQHEPTGDQNGGVEYREAFHRSLAEELGVGIGRSRFAIAAATPSRRGTSLPPVVIGWPSGAYFFD